jgi:hypothetical protein
MSRQFSTLFATAAFALCASASAAAYAQAAVAPKGQSQTVVRTETDGVSHEVKVIRDASGKVTVTRDGKTTVVDPHDAMAMGMGMHHRDPSEHLRNALQLRPNQEAALAAYVGAMHPQHNVMVLHSDDHDGPKTTPQRLAEMEKMLAEHDARMKAHIDATRAFYNQLDAGQKKAFDEMGGDGHMGMIQNVRFIHPMPGMPPMPPFPHMPVPPVPPTPPSF